MHDVIMLVLLIAGGETFGDLGMDFRKGLELRRDMRPYSPTSGPAISTRKTVESSVAP